ncbi:MAG TPA: SulP family inorganic anion transporter [Patescibacteria group bacterium]|nr:SulP family inorganic anion transporter [Patescibacteria group bacterium]
MIADLGSRIKVGKTLQPIPFYLGRPVRLLRGYERANIRPDLMAGLTVAVILLPQAIAFSLIADLPPQMGIYTAVIAAIISGLWGSSHQTHTGPANAISLLVLSILLTTFEPGTEEFILAAGMLALMAGLLQLALGLARLGMLVNFVSHSVIVGFATGAGVLIAVNQLPHLLGIEVNGEDLVSTLYDLIINIPELNPATTAIGLGTIIIILVLNRINKRLPAALIAMAISVLVVYLFDLTEAGVAVIAGLQKSLPSLAELPLLDLGFIQSLSTGALAVAAIGLVETTAIARSIATKTGQRLDSNQEFVGQGLANIAAGLFSGYPSAGSFSRSAVNFDAGAKSSIAAVFSALFLLAAVFLTAPLAAYLPLAALAGVLIVVSIGMINRVEIRRIWSGTRGDALIMLVTFLGTLFIEIAFAVLLGILLSFAYYLYRTSLPRVHQVVPDKNYKHFVYQPEMAICPQLGIVDILGDLYFGAVNHVEETILAYMDEYPLQRYLLIRMHNVNQCDFSGIHMLENVVSTYRERGGDVFLQRVGYRVNKLMESTAFLDSLGPGNILDDDTAVSTLFYHKLDPAVCIYECPVRVFKECRNLPKQLYLEDIPVLEQEPLLQPINEVSAQSLWEEMHNEQLHLKVIDVREPREYGRGHIPGAELMRLPNILSGGFAIAANDGNEIVFVCRSGRRSRRAAQCLMGNQKNLRILRGGMLAWEAAGLIEAID